MAAIILGGFLLGLAGSLHCVGMCGPIAISMPGFIGKPALLSRALYLTGKALTYTLLGFVFGLVGQRIALAGFQQALSIATGSLLLVWVLFWWLKPALLHSNWLTIKLSKWIAPAMGYFVHKRGAQASLLVGLLNGLLPCGLVYTALVASLATGHALNAALFMLAFGVGTMPLMLSFMAVAGQLGVAWRHRLRQWSPLLMGVLGLVLVLRGLELGIPLVSPMLPHVPGQVQSCHP